MLTLFSSPPATADQFPCTMLRSPPPTADHLRMCDGAAKKKIKHKKKRHKKNKEEDHRSLSDSKDESEEESEAEKEEQYRRTCRPLCLANHPRRHRTCHGRQKRRAEVSIGPSRIHHASKRHPHLIAIPYLPTNLTDSIPTD